MILKVQIFKITKVQTCKRKGHSDTTNSNAISKVRDGMAEQQYSLDDRSDTANSTSMTTSRNKRSFRQNIKSFLLNMHQLLQNLSILYASLRNSKTTLRVQTSFPASNKEMSLRTLFDMRPMRTALQRMVNQPYNKRSGHIWH